MGRYIACGIPVKISIYRSDRAEFEKEDVPQILESLKKFYNLDNFDLKEKKGDEYYMNFEMKKKFFDDNIHDVLRDVYYLHDKTESFLKNLYFEEYDSIDINDDSFNQKNYPIKLLKYTKKDVEPWNEGVIGEPYVKSKTDKMNTDSYFYSEGYWIFDDSKFKDKYSISISYITLWYDFNKFESEDETTLLKILNLLKTGNTSFKNDLTKTITYYIFG